MNSAYLAKTMRMSNPPGRFLSLLASPSAGLPVGLLAGLLASLLVGAVACDRKAIEIGIQNADAQPPLADAGVDSNSGMGGGSTGGPGTGGIVATGGREATGGSAAAGATSTGGSAAGGMSGVSGSSGTGGLADTGGTAGACPSGQIDCPGCATLGIAPGCAAVCPAAPCPAPGVKKFPTASLVWQAPGGAAAVGPAITISIYGSGAAAADTWTRIQAFDPALSAANSTATYPLTAEQTDDLFTRLAKVDTAALPHAGVAIECYPSLYYRFCSDCAATTIKYNRAAQLTPEMESVWAWFDQLLSAGAATNPRNYCGF